VACRPVQAGKGVGSTRRRRGHRARLRCFHRLLLLRWPPGSDNGAHLGRLAWPKAELTKVRCRAVGRSMNPQVAHHGSHRLQVWHINVEVHPIDCHVLKEQFVEAIDLIAFEKGQRKDDVTQKYLREFRKSEGVLYVGKAQEKARVMRTERRRCSRTGATYPWIVQSTAMVNHYYFYGVDEDFGPFFLKFCSYFPYNAKLCINGASLPSVGWHSKRWTTVSSPAPTPSCDSG
jgi:hypothetical protein